MRLKSLYIADYKNLRECTIDFLSGNGLSMIIGNNGSGKSNVLEAISAIFYDAYRKDRLKIKQDYILKYSIYENDVMIKRERGRRTFVYNGKFIKQDKFIRNGYLPSNVIGVYSGEESRLWTQYYEHYYRLYIKRIKENIPQSKMGLMFVNKYYWNIALLTLLLSQNTFLEQFIINELNINSIEKIVFIFNKGAFDKAVNEPLKAFIKRINPEVNFTLEITLKELKQRIFTNKLIDSDGQSVFTSEGEQILVDNGLLENEVFNYFIQACMPKKGKIITDIQICFNDILTTEQLSEGEKKLILLKSILEFIADEKSLLLLDEPDANIHEARKKKLYDMLLEYSSFDRQVVLTTHSPTLAQIATQTQLIMLEDKDGRAVPISADKIEKIQKLASDNWSVIEQNIIFSSSAPLIIFEGKTDVKYVKRALKLMEQVDPKYREIKVDIVSANGSGNVQFFINDFKALSPNKKMIAIFDRDDGGKKGAAPVAGISKDSEQIVKFNDINKDDIIVSFIPYRDGITNGEFMIEDYFFDETIEKIIKDITPTKKNPVKNLPNLPKKIKEEIEKRYLSFTLEEFKGFIPLLDKIIELISASTGGNT